MIEDIEPLAIRLVQDAPDLDPRTLAALRGELERVGSPLALAIGRIVELVGEGLVDPAIALPAVAEACATLVAGLEGRAGAAVLEAARYQIDTLEPMPDRPAPRGGPDVPIESVRPRRR